MSDAKGLILFLIFRIWEQAIAFSFIDMLMNLSKFLFLVMLALTFSCHKSKTGSGYRAPENFSVYQDFQGDQAGGQQDIDFLPGGRGATAGDFSVRITNDWGKTWTFVATPAIPGAFHAIAMKDDHSFYLAKNRLYYTSDNGSTYSTVFDSAVYDLKLTGPSSIVAASGDVVKSDDGGATWSIVYPHEGAAGFSQLNFIDNQTGFAWLSSSGNSKIIKTADGGSTWSAVYQTSTQTITEVDFVSNTTGYLVDSNNDVYVSTDGGTTWLKKGSAANSGAGYMRIEFIAPNEGYTWAAGTPGSVFVTHNGGITWKEAFNPQSGAPEFITRVKYVQGRVAIIGLSGELAWGY